MSATNPKNLSAFGLSALELDQEFAQLDRLAGEIDRLSIDSDHGLERARLLLSRFSECGLKIGDGVQTLARELEASRTRAEASAALVAVRAEQIQKRQTEANQLMARFQTLAEMVRKLSGDVAKLQKPGKEPWTDQERAVLTEFLPQLDSQLGRLAEEAIQVRLDAHSAHLKSLERDAESMSQSLQSLRRRIAQLAETPLASHLHSVKGQDLH